MHDCNNDSTLVVHVRKASLQKTEIFFFTKKVKFNFVDVFPGHTRTERTICGRHIFYAFVKEKRRRRGSG